MKTWLALLALCSGCAAPHRQAITTHELRQYCGRQDGLISLETWRDVEKGGGWFLLTTSDVQALGAVHTNQNALGGGSAFSTGHFTFSVDPQTGQIISATGTALGNVIGAAVSSAAGKP